MRDEDEMRDEDVVRKEVAVERAAYLKFAVANDYAAAAVHSRKLKVLAAEVSAIICFGADACPDCGNAPHGLRHMHVIPKTGRFYSIYEVGCLSCSDHRSQGESREAAVEAWNEGTYLPAKE